MEIMNFQYEGIELSAFVDSGGRDWFRGTEVCQVLKIVNPSTVIKRQAARYWKEIQVGVGRPAIYISEPGLYSLIFNSKSSDSEKFKEWVFETVLPSIRRDKGYIALEATAEDLQTLLAPFQHLLDACREKIESNHPLHPREFTQICEDHKTQLELKKHLSEGEYELKPFLMDAFNTNQQILSAVTKPVTIEHLLSHVDNFNAAAILAACTRLNLPIKYTTTHKSASKNLLNAIVSPPPHT